MTIHPQTVESKRDGNYLLGRLPGLLIALDCLGVALTGFVASRIAVELEVGMPLHPAAIFLTATLMVNYLYLAQGYGLRSIAHAAAQLVKPPAALIAAILSSVWIDWLGEDGREVFGAAAQIWLAMALLHLIGTRWAVQWQLARWQRQGRLRRRVAVLGSGQPAVELALRLRAAGDARLVGLFLDGELPGGAAVDVDGDVDILVSMAASGDVDEVIFASPWSSPDAFSAAFLKFSPLQTEIKMDPGLGPDIVPKEFGFVSDVPMLTLQRRPLRGWGGPLKRAEDVVLSGLLLIAVAPLFLLIAILIRIESRGPVIFRQERWGFNGNRIIVYKFRSMHHESSPDLAVPQARRNDPRVTRVGAILRRTSLDELPQLLNVLEGTMSLVGPRPHAAAHNEKYAKLIDGYLGRHRMKPGITGWAQVNGARGETESPHQMKRRLEYDLTYIAYWSLLLDLKVMFLTIPVVFRGTNAY